MSLVIRMWLVILLSLASLTSSWGREQPGPSADLLANPTYGAGIGLLYSCVTNYYVNANTGNDSNNGLTPGAAFATIQHADTLTLSPGTCINVAPATYTWGTAFAPTHGGNNASPTGYVVYRCQSLNACHIVYNGAAGTGQKVWALGNPYYIVDGFDVDCGEAAQFGGLANIGFASGINDTGTPGHHLWVLNNKIHGCGLSGIQFNESEFYFALHNEVYDNSWTSQFQGSGISYAAPLALGVSPNPYQTYTPTVYEQTFAPFHLIVSWNKVHDNGCAICSGAFPPLSTTANKNGNTTLSNIANIGTTASFTGTITAYIPNPDLGLLTVSGSTGTISVGDLLFFIWSPPTFGSQSNFLGTSIVALGTGTGGNGTYVINTSFYSSGLVTNVAMTTSTLGKGTLVSGLGIQPLTYISSIAGNTATLTRPATTSATGGAVTFYTPSITNHTDGNGIIMDTFCGTPCGGVGTAYNYPDKQTLITFNDVQFNGNRGIHLFSANYVTAANNSTYHNGIDLYINGFAGEYSNSGSNNTWYNNISLAVGSILFPCAFNYNETTCNLGFISGDGRGGSPPNAGNVFNDNIVFFVPPGLQFAFFNAPEFATWNAGNNLTKDPLYIDETSLTLGNLQLQGSSPAINFAVPHAFPYLPKGTTDGGAWQTGGKRTSLLNVGGIPEFSGDLGYQNVPVIPTPLSCSQATAWLARISGYDRVHNDGYSNLICGMVNAGLWCGTKLDAFWVTATYQQTAANLNLCSTNYTLILHGNPTFTVDKGYTGIDGSSTVFIDTQFNPATAISPLFTQNDAHVSQWINNNVLSVAPFSGVSLGGSIATSNATALTPRQDNGSGGANYQVDVNNLLSSNTHTMNQPTSLGHFLATRSDPTTVRAYFDAILQFTDAQASALTNVNIYLLATNNNGSAVAGSPNQLGATTIGKGMSNTDQGNLCHLLNVYMTAIGNGQAGTC